MKPSLPILLAALGLLVGGAGGSYWYSAHGHPGQTPGTAPEVSVAFIDLDRKFVVPLIKGNQMRALVVTELKLEVRRKAEQRALEMKPRLRDAFLGTLYAMAVEGLFDGDLFSDSLQDRMRERLLAAAQGVLAEDAVAVLIAELLRQDR